MRTKTKTRLFDLLAAVTAAVGILLVVKTIASDSQEFKNPFNHAQAEIELDAESRAKLTLADFGDLFEKRLQGKPEAPPPKTVTQTNVQQPKAAANPVVRPPNFKLTAILYFSSFSLATFEVSGKPLTCAIGEEVAGARVSEIEPTEVKYSFRGKEFSKTIEN